MKSQDLLLYVTYIFEIADVSVGAPVQIIAHVGSISIFFVLMLKAFRLTLGIPVGKLAFQSHGRL